MTSTRPEIYWDPYDNAIDADPYGVWRQMRDEMPVYRNDAHDFWALSRYADVQAASRDVATFSSSRGTVLEMMGNDMTGSKMMIFMDPPAHDALRVLVSRAFTPRRIAALGESITEICTEYLDPLVGSGGFDFVADFGAQLPSRVISQLLGVSPEDRPHVLQLINRGFHHDPKAGMINEIAVGAMLELYQWVLGAALERRAKPRDDMLSVLVQSEIDEDGVKRGLTDEELSGFGILLVTAGTETVARLLGWAAVTLSDHPAQLTELAADHTLIPNAVEELLRFEAPSPVQGRTVLHDAELHGQVLPAGSKVLLLTGSAGRDERVYPDPDRFDIHRRFDQHVSFGVGAHYCLGAALARLEGSIALEETLKRFPSFAVDKERVVRSFTSTVRGHSHVPLVIG